MERLVAKRGTGQDRRVAGSAAYDMTSGVIAHARGFVRDFLSQAQSLCGLDVPARALDTAQLVVSELATNVCRYAPGPCLLDLEVDDSTLDITMWDSGSALPTTSAPDPTRVGQHGLEIVRAVSRNFEVHHAPVGKRVRARISLLEGAA